MRRNLRRGSERLRAFVGALVCASVIACPATHARADEALSAADGTSLKQRGDAAFDARRFADAAKLYEDAYAVSREPALLYNLGRTYEALGRYADALDRLVAFSSAASPDLRQKTPGLDALIDGIRARVATLTLTCNVAGARVVIRDVVAGETSSARSFELNAGSAKIEVSKDSYLGWVKTVDLTGGRTTVLDVILVPRDSGGVLVVKSNASGASISVDGTPAGQTPIELALRSGSHALELTREGYEPRKTLAIVTAGARKELSVDLDTTPGITSRWWFWTGIGVVVVGGAVTVWAVTREKDVPSGTLEPGRASAPLMTF